MDYSKNKRFNSPSGRIAIIAVFTAFAIVLSVIESILPTAALLPVPGFKIGLANIVTVFAIVTMRPSETFFIITVRCLVAGLFTGPVSLLFSLTGALLAFFVMLALLPAAGKAVSPVGLSIAGAGAHNIGQTVVAAFLLKDIGIMLFYLPFLLVSSVFTGAITGIVAIPVIDIINRKVLPGKGKL